MDRARGANAALCDVRSRRLLEPPGVAMTADGSHDVEITLDSDPREASLRSSAEDAARSVTGSLQGTEMEDRGLVAFGGMAEVRRAFDRMLQRLVAVKLLRRGASERMRERFTQEARITGQLEHPNIIPVHSLAADRFSMKLVHGETLAERLERQAQPPSGHALAEFVRDMLKVCDALAFAHSRGVIHRDLKSENIMLGLFGEVYLVDWGAALVRGQPDSRPATTLVGTPAFMSPEAACGMVERIDERTDVFGVGAVLYEVLTLQPPHIGRDVEEVLRAARRCQIVPPHQIPMAAHQPAALCDIVMRALSVDPGDRHPSITDLRADLDGFLQSGAWFGRRHVAAGVEIVREGDPGTEAYVVEQGQCEVFRGEGGAQQVLRQLGPGDVFGELALFGSGLRTASVRARSDVSLLVISSEALERQFPSGSWPRHFLDTLAARFCEAEARESSPR